MYLRSFMALVTLCAASLPAWAGGVTVPESGILELLAISGIVGVAIAVRKRRK